MHDPEGPPRRAVKGRMRIRIMVWSRHGLGMPRSLYLDMHTRPTQITIPITSSYESEFKTMQGKWSSSQDCCGALLFECSDQLSGKILSSTFGECSRRLRCHIPRNVRFHLLLWIGVPRIFCIHGHFFDTVPCSHHSSL